MWTDRKQKLVKFRTVNVMKTWLESYLMEEDCEALLRDILNFAMSALNDSSAAQQILRVVEKRVSGFDLSILCGTTPSLQPIRAAAERRAKTYWRS